MNDDMHLQLERTEHPKWVRWFAPMGIVSLVFSIVVLLLVLFDVINLKEKLILGGVACLFISLFNMPLIIYFDRLKILLRENNGIKLFGSMDLFVEIRDELKD